MKFSEYLQSSAHDITSDLTATLLRYQKNIVTTYPSLSPLFSAFIEQCSGGKRIRGALVLLGYALAGRKKTAAVLPAAVAFEMFQTAILAHDDIIDKSEIRRGKPSLFMALGGDHYGISQTISLGDLGFFLATEILSAGDFPDAEKNKALVFFSQVLQETALGEMLDVYQPTVSSFTDQDVLNIAKSKTANYSFIGPLTIGAILGGGSEKQLTDIKKFGENLGIAYQIHDDVLGIFSDEKTLGKSSASDILEGKRTLLFWYARDKASLIDREKLDSLYGTGVTNEEADQIRSIFESTGARQYALDQVANYTEKARERIAALTEDKTLQELLYDMTSMLLERKK